MKKLDTKEIKLLFGQGKYTVKCDKWDVEDFNRIKECSRELIKLQGQGSALLPSFPELMQDVFNSMYKANPEIVPEWEVSKEMLFNRVITEQLQENRRLKEIRTMSQLDPLASSAGLSSFSEELMTILTEEKEKQQLFQDFLDAANDYEQASGEGDQSQDGAGASDTDGDEGAESSEQPGQSTENLSIEEAKKRLEDAYNNFKESTSTPEFKTKLNNAFAKVRDKVVETTETLKAWGLNEDHNFQKMDYRQKVDMMDRLENSSKLKKVAEITGRLSALAMSQQNQKIKRGSEEVYNVEMGRDLSRLLPSELMKLQDPLRETEFLLDFCEGRCLQYALKGKEKQARGPIVCAIDESGSMFGASEIWSKAVALSLYNIATKQKRSFYAIHFDGARNPLALPVHSFLKNDPPDMTKVIEMAEMFLGGGTNFESPLTRARMCIEEQPDFHKADVIFITDGECAVRTDWVKDFNKWRKEKGVNIFSILIDSGYNSVSGLKEFSTSIFKLSDLKDSAESAMIDIFSKI